MHGLRERMNKNGVIRITAMSKILKDVSASKNLIAGLENVYTIQQDVAKHGI